MTDQKNTPPQNALDELGKTLADIRKTEDDKLLALQKKKELLLSKWTQLLPLAKQAIAQVSAVKT